MVRPNVRGKSGEVRTFFHNSGLKKLLRVQFSIKVSLLFPYQYSIAAILHFSTSFCFNFMTDTSFLAYLAYPMTNVGLPRLCWIDESKRIIACVGGMQR